MARRKSRPQQNAKSSTRGTAPKTRRKEEGLLLGRPVEDRGFEAVEIGAAAATGIGIGALVAGPVGAAVGGAVGTAIGAAAGEVVEHSAGAAAETMDTSASDDDGASEDLTSR